MFSITEFDNHSINIEIDRHENRSSSLITIYFDMAVTDIGHLQAKGCVLVNHQGKPATQDYVIRITGRPDLTSAVYCESIHEMCQRFGRFWRFCFANLH